MKGVRKYTVCYGICYTLSLLCSRIPLPFVYFLMRTLLDDRQLHDYPAWRTSVSLMWAVIFCKYIAWNKLWLLLLLRKLHVTQFGEVTRTFQQIAAKQSLSTITKCVFKFVFHIRLQCLVYRQHLPRFPHSFHLWSLEGNTGKNNVSCVFQYLPEQPTGVPGVLPNKKIESHSTESFGSVSTWNVSVHVNEVGQVYLTTLITWQHWLTELLIDWFIFLFIMWMNDSSIHWL